LARRRQDGVRGPVICKRLSIVYSLISLGEEVCLERPAKIADYLRSVFDENPFQEAVYCVYLNRKNHPLGRHLITLGTATAHWFLREKFSGEPSWRVPWRYASRTTTQRSVSQPADIQVTRKLREVARTLEIEMLDHLVCGDAKADPQGRGFYSFHEARFFRSGRFAAGSFLLKSPRRLSVD